MSLESFPLVPASTSHEVRRDFAELIGGARPIAGAADVNAAWRDVPETWLDLLCDPRSIAERDGFVDRVRGLDHDVSGALLIARSALAEVGREVPAADSLGRNLRRLLGSEALCALDHVLLAFDDLRWPYVGLSGERRLLLPLFERLRRLADETVPVLVTGETGTGKEVAARALHRLGRRRTRPWMAINCAELPDSLLESELFGHARGAFTGAAMDRPGLFEAAADGTAFLDELGELPAAAQAKLLRLLEEHRVRRLGSSESRTLHCRIVAATNRELPTEIQRGGFRADLFYRLRGTEIRLAPLRERPSDVLPLAERFTALASLRFRRRVLGLSEEARLALAAHSWPGNVRELRQVVEAAVLAADDRWIRLRDLSIVSPGAAPPSSLTVRAVERATIVRALERTAGNKMAAARLLGLTRQSLQRRIERHRIMLSTERGRNSPEAVTPFERPVAPSPRNSGGIR
jgi:transcriptional regulator with AAA-type ATPase domain